MITNKEIDKELRDHGEILSRLDERTRNIQRWMENVDEKIDNTDERMFYLERKDSVGTIVTTIIAAIAAVIGFRS